MKNVQLIVPMTGTGQRFKDAGYKDLKPLIKVNDLCYFEHVVSMFLGMPDILFIISKEEPQKHVLQEKIRSSFQYAKVLEIDAHKFGPSYAVLQAQESISDNKKIVVCYCDFYASWDFQAMLEQLSNMDGSILTYTGFHPHMLRNSKYAYVKKNAELVTAIQEKNPFTDSPMSEEASAGCYGFSNKAVLIDAIKSQINRNLKFQGEFYTSLTYLPILEKGGRVGTILASHFSQWGTPEDLADWQYWNKCKNHDASNCIACRDETKFSMTTLILAAGAGRRVARVTKTSKPNIRVGKLRLWEHSKELGKRGDTFVITRKEVGLNFSKDTGINLVEIEGITQGQAMTAKIGLEYIGSDNTDPVHILSSDNVMCAGAVVEAMSMVSNADLVVWTTFGYPPAQYFSEQYSWLNVNSEGKIQGIIAKKSPTDPKNTPLIIGNFTFKNRVIALRLIQLLEISNTKINGEFYLDSVIELALQEQMKVSYIQVNSFYALGTELELKIHEYYWKQEVHSDE